MVDTSSCYQQSTVRSLTMGEFLLIIITDQQSSLEVTQHHTTESFSFPQID